MKSLFIAILPLILFYAFACNSQQNTFHVKVMNPNNFTLTDAYLEFQVDDIEENFVIKQAEKLIPYQIVADAGSKKTVCLVLNLNANEEKILKIEFGNEVQKPEFKSRTYAELSMKTNNVYFDKRFRGKSFVNVNKIKVPTIHTDHDALFKYEGPGWESEKVGYRYYLDWRNAIDIFGKKKDQLILATVGVHDTVAKDDSYHNMQEWGMDIFKVGNSLGIGSYGMWHNDKVNMVSKTDSIYFEIIQNGPIISEIRTSYYGWQIDKNKYYLESKLSITAGSRLTKNEISISDDPSNIVTGVAKYPGTNFFKNDVAGEWSYIALFGNQTLVSDNDKLGIALFFRTRDLEELTEDELSHVLKLKPNKGSVSYYFCAAWEQEENGIKDFDQFKNYLNETQHLLNNPLIVEIK